jgi:hypothetical protein
MPPFIRLLTVLALTVAAFGQRVGGASTIEGKVFSAADGHPALADVLVVCADETGREVSETRSSEAGTFAFENVPPGRYRIMARRPGFVTATYGARRFDLPGRLVSVVPGQTVPSLVITMSPGAAIAGKIIGADREPSGGAGVRVLRFVAGMPREMPTSTGFWLTRSDSTGGYRIYGLPEGQYLVVARPRGSFRGDVYYPGTQDQLAAQRLTVRPGEELTGVDLSLTPTNRASLTVRVDGTLPGSTTRVRLIPGTAEREVPPGQFAVRFDGLRARLYRAVGETTPNGEGAPTLAGDATISVGLEGEYTAPVALLPTVTLTGRVTMGGRAPSRIPDGTAVTLTPAEALGPADVISSRVTADGAFAFRGVRAGAYVLGVGSGARSEAPHPRVERAMLDGVEVAGRQVTLEPGRVVAGVLMTLSPSTQRVHGRVLRADGDVGSYTVVLFPVDRALWSSTSGMVEATNLDSQAEYAFGFVAVGDYFIGVVSDYAEEELWQSSFLEELGRGAVRVRVGVDADVTQDIEIVSQSEHE